MPILILWSQFEQLLIKTALLLARDSIKAKQPQKIRTGMEKNKFYSDNFEIRRKNQRVH